MDQSTNTAIADLSSSGDSGFSTTDSPFFASNSAENTTQTLTPSNTSDNSSTVVSTSSSSSGNGGRRRVIMIGIALLLMVVGIASGTVLLSQQQFDTALGWDCELYKFNVDEAGSVSVQNGSQRNLPAQVATVFIDNQQVKEFEVPALDSGMGESLGTVPVPENGQFSWRVKGNKDCDQTGGVVGKASAQCTDIKAFDEEWNLLTAEDLSALTTGDVVRFSVAGSTTDGSILAARFTINGELRQAVTQIRPGTEEFYDEYEIPEDTTDFSVDVELNHSKIGWF